MRAGLAGLDGFVIDDVRGRRLEACQSPVWDTALAVVALADAGLPADDPALVRAADWLLREEVRVAGDWAVRRPRLAPGGWAFEFENDTYPDVDDTAEVVLALRKVAHPEPARVDAAVAPDDRAVRRAVRWLEQHQNPDGGWGEDCRSYREPEWIGRGESTASQTAWALLALLAAGERSPAVERGVAWLVERQTDDGTWDEPWFTGTGFPGDFLINYHLYRHVFPLTALGRYLRAQP